MKRLLLSVLILAVSLAAEKKPRPEPDNFMDFQAPCNSTEDVARKVFDEIGFAMVRRHANENVYRTGFEYRYNTKGWRKAKDAAGRAAKLEGGFLDVWYDLKPTDADLMLSGGRTEDGKHFCQAMLDIEWIVFKRGFVMEGYEHVRSTKAMEAHILGLIRARLIAAGMPAN